VAVGSHRTRFCTAAAIMCRRRAGQAALKKPSVQMHDGATSDWPVGNPSPEQYDHSPFRDPARTMLRHANSTPEAAKTAIAG